MNELMYECYLNGNLYGVGDLKYILELFEDYVVTCKMYNQDECEFNIKKMSTKHKKKENANDKLAKWLNKL